MKVKAFSLALIMLIACLTGVFSGCETIINNNPVFAEEVSYELSSLNARVGDVISLEDNAFNIFPSTVFEVTLSFSSSNPQIAQIDAITGEINCLQEGTVIIYGRVKVADNNFVGDSFTLTINERLVYATGFSLESEEDITVGLNGDAVINSLNIEGVNVNVMPVISYSNVGIVSYDYVSGQINAISLGSTTVFVTLELENSEQLTRQFEVFVVEQILYIEAQNIYQSQKEQFFYISYTVVDNTKENNLATSQTVEVQILTTNNLIEVIIVDYQNILIKTLNSSGTAIIRLTYANDATVTKDIGIEIN